MRHVIVALDMIEVDRRCNVAELVEIAQVAPEVRIVDDAAEIALEMSDVHGIEADQRDEEAPIGLGR